MAMVNKRNASRPFSRAMLALAALCLAAPGARAAFTSRLQVGNWNGGVWADDNTKQFRNCGLSLKFSGGTEFTVLVTPELNPLFIVIDPKIQATPQQQLTAPVKFDQGAELRWTGFAVSATMVQFGLPPIPDSYDKVRKATKFAFILPGLNTTVDITGIAQVMPRLYECVIAERGKLALPPSAADVTPADRKEAASAGLALAEKAGVGAYMVFPDKERPPGFQGAPVVWGYPGVAGPGGPTNVLSTADWRPASDGDTIQQARAKAVERLRAIAANAVIGDLPALPGKPDSAGVSVVVNNTYEEIYLARRKNGGYFQFSTSSPLAGRKTAEAIGEKYRAAIAAIVP